MTILKAAIIVITGTPGVGKSTLARFLEKKWQWRRLDLHRYYQQISEGYNQKKQCYDVDSQKLKRLVQKIRIQSNIPLLIDSHIAHHLPRNMVTLCVIVTSSNLKQLRKRLETRGYPTTKIRENMDAEIFQICLMEAQERGHHIFIVNDLKQRMLPTIGKKIKELIQKK